MIWRIRERGVFAQLAHDGRRARAGVLWCTFLPDPSASPPRVGFAIGRAIGSSVVRNQVRRRLKVLLAEAALPPGWYLVGARPGIVERSFSDMRRDVTALVSSVSNTSSPTVPTVPSSPSMGMRTPSTGTGTGSGGRSSCAS